MYIRKSVKYKRRKSGAERRSRDWMKQKDCHLFFLIVFFFGDAPAVRLDTLEPGLLSPGERSLYFHINDFMTASFPREEEESGTREKLLRRRRRRRGVRRCREIYILSRVKFLLFIRV